MENKALMKAGEYFVGDVSRVLQIKTLRNLFFDLYHYGRIENPGLTMIEESRDFDDNNVIWKDYWVVNAPYKSGTFYDNKNNSYGFDLGVFGCIQKEWVNEISSQNLEVISFKKDFEVYTHENKIFIDDLILSTDPN